MKEFLLAASAVIALLYVGKKLSATSPPKVSPAPLPPPTPPSPTVQPVLEIKDGDKVIVDGKTLAVLSATEPLLVATGTPYTDPKNQARIPRSLVSEVVPRKKG